MNYSSSYLLSQLGVPYDDTADVDQRLNDALTILAAAIAGSYHTPGFAQTQISSASFDPGNVAGAGASLIACQAAIATGNLATAHAAVDTLNGWRTKTGGAEYVPIPDLEILGNSTLSVGFLLRRLQALATPPLLLSNTTKANGIVQTAEAAPPPPPPPPIALVIQAPPGLFLPSGIVIPASDGSQWTFFSTPFGNILVKTLS